MAHWIISHHRIIQAIRVHIEAEHALTRADVDVRRDEAAGYRIVVATVEVIESQFRVVVIALVAEGVEGTDADGGGVGHRHQLAPRVVGVGHHGRTVAVDQAQYLPEDVVHVIVGAVVVGERHDLALRVIVEIEHLVARFLTDDLRAVEGVVGRDAVDRLGRAHTVGVVQIAHRAAVVGGGLKPPPQPRKLHPVAVLERTTQAVVHDEVIVVPREHIAPLRVRILHRVGVGVDGKGLLPVEAGELPKIVILREIVLQKLSPTQSIDNFHFFG